MPTRTHNFNDGVWAYGTPLPVKAKNVWNGRVFTRIVDTNKRLIMKRTLVVRPTSLPDESYRERR